PRARSGTGNSPTKTRRLSRPQGSLLVLAEPVDAVEDDGGISRVFQIFGRQRSRDPLGERRLDPFTIINGDSIAEAVEACRDHFPKCATFRDLGNRFDGERKSDAAERSNMPLPRLTVDAMALGKHGGPADGPAIVVSPFAIAAKPANEHWRSV